MQERYEPDAPPVPLDAVLVTDELDRRPARPPDYAAEARALSALAESMVDAPRHLLQRLAEVALDLCRADSTGLSILETGADGGRFRWPAVAGLWARYSGSDMPRDASTCGVVIAHNSPLLFSRPEQAFPAAAIEPPIVEILLVPFHVAGEPVGTVWAIAHTPARKFDAEDARLLTSLARFASAAHRLVSALDEAQAGRDDLGRRVEERTRELSDITVSLRREAAERDRAEAARREAEERFRLIVENVRDYAICFLDAGGRIVSWNDGAGRLLGYRAEEVLGGTIDRFYTPEDLARHLPGHELEAAAAAGGAGDENWMVRKDGTRFWASGSTTALADASGKPRGFVKIFRDLTERRAAEQALVRARDEMEARVAERTGELARANRTLMAEAEERRRIEADRTRLIRMLVTAEEDERRRISRELHDQLGQELTGLILGLKALEPDVPEGAPGRSRLRELQEAVDRVGRETHDLAVDLRPTALDDLGLHAALVTLVRRWSARSGIPADFLGDDRVAGRCSQDAETAIFRVVQEALTNVAKHAQAARVSVILERRDGHLVLIVEDDGLGFAPEEDDGAGRLGLLGMRERVSLAGGSLQVESSPGAGTTIRALIPVASTTGGAKHG